VKDELKSQAVKLSHREDIQSSGVKRPADDDEDDDCMDTDNGTMSTDTKFVKI